MLFRTPQGREAASVRKLVQVGDVAAVESEELWQIKMRTAGLILQRTPLPGPTVPSLRNVFVKTYRRQ